MHSQRQAGRLAAIDEKGKSVFRVPPRRTQKIELATARAFIVEATKREEAFVELGLPPTFLSDFTALVDRLQAAVDTRLTSKIVRGRAQAGIAEELARGFRVVLDLDVVMAVVDREDPVLAATWRLARKIEGQRRRRAGDEVVPDTRDGQPTAP